MAILMVGIVRKFQAGEQGVTKPPCAFLLGKDIRSCCFGFVFS